MIVSGSGPCQQGLHFASPQPAPKTVLWTSTPLQLLNTPLLPTCFQKLRVTAQPLHTLSRFQTFIRHIDSKNSVAHPHHVICMSADDHTAPLSPNIRNVSPQQRPSATRPCPFISQLQEQSHAAGRRGLFHFRVIMNPFQPIIGSSFFCDFTDLQGCC
jgi:hypothetical protein